ncbi:hypothetical protein ACFYU8_17960 [Brevibacillus sp. NPDC003359]|uniref:hypothetical protein n=1 Tax=unclassified Brevibacillus TaxID=2684853 RepID=UPI0036A45BA1
MDSVMAVKVLQDCITNLDELLSDLNVSNPTYRTAFDVGENPVIFFVSQVMGRNPMFYAEPIGENVRFDISKIRQLRIEVENLKASIQEIDS